MTEDSFITLDIGEVFRIVLRTSIMLLLVGVKESEADEVLR